MNQQEARVWADALQARGCQAAIKVESYAFAGGAPHYAVGVEQKGEATKWLYTTVRCLQALVAVQGE